MANRVFSIAAVAVALGAGALLSSLAVTPAAAWTHYRHVRVHGYASAHHITVVRHPVYRSGYPVAVYSYYPPYVYGYRPGPLAVGVNAAGTMAVSVVGAAAGLAAGILGLPYGYYPGYVYVPGYPAW
jgi:hypothetical protein